MALGLGQYVGLNSQPSLTGQSFQYLGSAVGDIFTGLAEEDKAKGSALQAKQYEEASQFASLEARIQAGVTTVNTAQSARAAYMGIGGSRATVAGAGFGGGGSAGDVLRSSAEQGALQTAVTKQTGQVAEQGYIEEAKSYDLMAQASLEAEKAEKSSAMGSYIGAGLMVAAFLL